VLQNSDIPRLLGEAFMNSPSRWPAASRDPAGEFPVDLTTYVFHLFAVVGRHRDARLEEALKPLGLNLSRHRAISVIQALEPCTMSEVADFSAVDRTTLTRTIDPLVAGGLVQRTTPPEDRRQVVLTLTEAGHDACRRSLRAIFRLNRELLAGVAEAEQRAVARALEAFVACLVADETLRARVLLRDETGSG
jgi:MarR family transcriptional regulator, lower aerobic nicotinate degradation pathway regulator